MDRDWFYDRYILEALHVAEEAGRRAGLYEAEQIIRAHARDCGCWERMLTDVDRERSGTSVFSSGAGAAGDQGPAKKPADTGPAPDIAADREALGQILELGTLSPGQWVEVKKLCRDMVTAAREHGRREGSAAALMVAAADIRLLASEGWTHAKAVDVLEMAARRIEAIATPGQHLCSICRRYHGKEITHACE